MLVVRPVCPWLLRERWPAARPAIPPACRRIGFGRWANYVIALPTIHGTPTEGANKAGVACPAPLSGNSQGAQDVGQARKEYGIRAGIT